MTCPDEQTLAEFADRRLVGPQREGVETHVAGCDACDATLRVLVELYVPDDVTVADTVLDDRASPSVELPAGIALGRFEIIEEIGRGGMGVVFAAYDPELDRKVALKVLRRHRDATADLEARLRREAQAMARLVHPNVVTVLDVGVDREGREPRLFVAMEYVEGTTLRGWLAGAPRTTTEILDVLQAAGLGLAAAHAAGIVHRDFKPDNVLVDVDGHARVTDFGLARAFAAPDSAASTIARGRSGSLLSEEITRSDAVVGTVAYMAPEQLREGEVGPAADQFAWWVALYEALVRVRPFPHADWAERLRAIDRGELRGGDRAARGIPSRLRRVIRRGLSADPAARFVDMRAALQAVAHARRPGAARGLLAALGVVAAAAVAVLARDPEPATALDSETTVVDVVQQARIDQVREEIARGRAKATASRDVDALDVLRGAVEKARDLEHPPLLVEALVELGAVEGELGKTASAEAVLQEAVTLSVAHRLHDTAALAMLRVMELRVREGDHAEVRRLYPLALGHVEAAGGDKQMQRRILLQAGYNERLAGDLDAAHALWRDAGDLSRSFGDRVLDAVNVSILAADLGDWGTVKEVTRPLVEAASFLPSEQAGAALLRYNLAGATCRLGDVDASLVEYREVAQSYRAQYETHPMLASVELATASCLVDAGRASEARPHLQTARELLERAEGNRPARDRLAVLELVLDAADAPLSELDVSLSHLRERLAEHQSPTSVAAADLDAWVGDALVQRGEHEAAVPVLRRALSGHERALGDDAPATHVVRVWLGLALAATGEHAESRQLLDRALAALKPELGHVRARTEAQRTRETL